MKIRAVGTRLIHEERRLDRRTDITKLIVAFRNFVEVFNPINAELNPICHLLALLGVHFLHVSRIRVKSLTLRLLMSYIYMEHQFLMFLDHTQRRTTVGRTPLDERSARRRDFYLTTHDTHNRQISMPPVGFEPKISAGELNPICHLLALLGVHFLHVSRIRVKLLTFRLLM